MDDDDDEKERTGQRMGKGRTTSTESKRACVGVARNDWRLSDWHGCIWHAGVSDGGINHGALYMA